jgi:UTP--glucose-1-phosphate uridylyltransferase
MKVRKAVIPVAGMGTRLLPATKVVPKELVPVVSRPSIQWVVEAAVASGITDVVLVTSAGKSAIEDHFDRAPELERALEEKGKADLLAAVRRTRELARLASVRQAAPLGLGHAIACARSVVGDEPFAVILPDELVLGEPPALAQCLETAAETGASTIGIVEVPLEDVPRYGIVDAREHGERTRRVLDLVEKPSMDEAPSRLAITGPYVLSPDIFTELERLRPGAGGELQLTDALRGLAARTEMYGRLIEGERLDVGQPLGFVQANVAMGLVDPDVGPALLDWLRARLGRD